MTTSMCFGFVLSLIGFICALGSLFYLMSDFDSITSHFYCNNNEPEPKDTLKKLDELLLLSLTCIMIIVCLFTWILLFCNKSYKERKLIIRLNLSGNIATELLLFLFTSFTVSTDGEFLLSSSYDDKRKIDSDSRLTYDKISNGKRFI